MRCKFRQSEGAVDMDASVPCALEEGVLSSPFVLLLLLILVSTVVAQEQKEAANVILVRRYKQSITPDAPDRLLV